MKDYRYEKCENCYYYREQECRRKPPIYNMNEGGNGIFPVVSPFSWCGEYKPESEARQT